MKAVSRTGLLTILAKVWAYPLWVAVSRSGADGTVRRDLARWVECIEVDEIAGLDEYTQFARLAGSLEEFRSLIHYRISSLPLPATLLLKRLYPGLATLYIQTPGIGPGLFIQHGFSTCINAAEIGENCWINQDVSIGFSAKGRPVLGDNVRIAAGAKVFGPIAVGDNATVGANVSVSKDVAPGALLVQPLPVDLNEIRAARAAAATDRA